MNDYDLDQLLDLWQAPPPSPSVRRALAASLPVRPRRLFGLRVRWLAIFAAALVCIAAADELLTNPELGRFYAGWDNGLYMRTIRMVSPPQAQMHWWMTGAGYSAGGQGTLHGSADMHVRSTKTFYGYEYRLEPIGGGEYRIAFAPLQLTTLQRRRGPFQLSGSIAPSPALPAPQSVPMGQPVEVTIYQDATSRVYDQLLFQWGPFSDWPKKQGSARHGVMRLVSPKLTIDGSVVQTAGGNPGSGPVAWLHLPGAGRYLIALDPQGNARFVEAGRIDGNSIEFQSDGHYFKIVCAEPITPGASRPVYVYRQQSFESVLDPTHPLTASPFFGNAGPASLHVE